MESFLAYHLFGPVSSAKCGLLLFYLHNKWEIRDISIQVLATFIHRYNSKLNLNRMIFDSFLNSLVTVNHIITIENLQSLK